MVLPVNLAGHFLDVSWINFVSKPLLMPMLIAGVSFELVNSPQKWVLMGALFFSWIGDVVLLFEAQIPVLFLVGLGAFFIAHLLYVLVFIWYSKRLDFSSIQRIFFFVFLVIYTFGLVQFLWGYLGEFRVPVVAYALILLTMGITSAARPKSASYLWVVAGAALFIASDSLLAINKFVMPIWKPGVLIMSTYGMAQLLITIGLTRKSAKAG